MKLCVEFLYPYYAVAINRRPFGDSLPGRFCCFSLFGNIVCNTPASFVDTHSESYLRRGIGMNDGDIVNLFLDRDEKALRVVADQYGKRLHGVSFRITRDRETSEECVNDTYLEAWHRIPPSEPRNYLKAFLYKIVRAKSLIRIIHDHRLKRQAYVDELTTELEQCIPSKKLN